MVYQCVAAYEKHFEKIVKMIKSRPGHIVDQKTFKICTNISLKKRIHRIPQLWTIDIVIPCIHVPANEYGTIKKLYRFNRNS